MIGAIITDWKERFSGVGFRDPLLLTATQFHREVMLERIRATRRSFPFCVITIGLKQEQKRRRPARTLVRMLHRNLRMTDHKAILGTRRYGILLTDTPEMGGRSVIDRLTNLARDLGLSVEMDLRVHDPEGFTPDDDALPGDSQRRFDRKHETALVDGSSDQHGRGEALASDWSAFEGDVEVTSEDPIVAQPPLRMFAKRALDIFGASTGLILTGPIILTSMFLVKRQDGASPIFKQTREGRGGRPFTIYKLRTMIVNAEETQHELRAQSHRDGPAFKISHDPRVTPVGQFLRKSCIDELPQLWNVLIGDMSLVGPRPLPWHESRACDAWHRRRLDVRPGMTCYWQVEKDKVETFDDWMRLDLKYLNKFGVLEDLRLIARTITVPMMGRGSE